MSVVTLSLVILPEDLEDSLAEAATLSAEAKQEVLETFKDTERMFSKGDIAKLPRAYFADVTGDDGIRYDVAEFVVTSRYKTGGEQWVEGGRFRINLTKLTRDMSSFLGE
jgi:hypothetical protein